MTMSKEALEARKEYMRNYRKKNREHINKTFNEWKKSNPEKVKQYEANYWEKVAQEMLKQDA